MTDVNFQNKPGAAWTLPDESPTAAIVFSTLSLSNLRLNMVMDDLGDPGQATC